MNQWVSFISVCGNVIRIEHSSIETQPPMLNRYRPRNIFRISQKTMVLVCVHCIYLTIHVYSSDWKLLIISKYVYRISVRTRTPQRFYDHRLLFALFRGNIFRIYMDETCNHIEIQLFHVSIIGIKFDFIARDTGIAAYKDNEYFVATIRVFCIICS